MAEVDFPLDKYNGMKFVAPPTVAEYYWDTSKQSWIFSPEQASGGRITIANSPPSQRESVNNDLWIDNRDYSLYVFDGDAMNWIGLTNFGLTASVFVGDIPPLYQQPGALWYDNNTGDLKVSYEQLDIDNGVQVKNKAWVALTGNGINQTISSNMSDVQDTLDAILSRLEVMENGNYFSL